MVLFALVVSAVISCAFAVLASSRPDPLLCHEAPHFLLAGRDLMAQSRGNVLFLALMEVDCQYCLTQINGLKSTVKVLAESGMEDTEFVIIAPRNTSDGWLHYWQGALKSEGVQVIRDTERERVWETLRAQNHDFHLYDRCSRLVYFIPHPQSNLYYHYTISSLYSVYRDAKCGACALDPEPAATASKRPIILPPRVVAYLGTDDGQGGRLPSPLPFTRRPPATTDRRPTTARPSPTPTTDFVQHITGYPTVPLQEIDIEAPIYPEFVTPNYEDAYYDEAYYYENGDRKTDKPLSQKPSTHKAAVTQAPTELPEERQFTQEATAQVPPTPAAVKSAAQDSAAAPSRRTTTSSTSSKPPPPPPPPPRRPIMVDGVRCDDFDDPVCYELQQKRGASKLPGCCYKGIYLTDACTVDRCTNDTFPLCCTQKFFQARYLCCNDKELTGGQVDEFSRCCYSKLVLLDGDDPCCPADVSGRYWSEEASLFELCLPNVNIDFAGVLIEAQMRDGSQVSLNLAKQTVLEQSCPYESKRADFFYYQPSVDEEKLKDEIRDAIDDYLNEVDDDE